MTRIVTSFAIPFSIVYRWVDRPTLGAAVSETLFRWCSPSNEEWVYLLRILYFQMEAALESRAGNTNCWCLSNHKSKLSCNQLARLLRRISQSSSVVRFHLPRQPTCLLQKKHVSSCLCKLKLIIVCLIFPSTTTKMSIKWKFPIQSQLLLLLFFFFSWGVGMKWNLF